VSVEEQEEPDWTERLPLFVRIPLGLIGLLSIAIGLATAVFWFVAASMSAGHGGDAIPNLEIAIRMLLPISLIAFGISGVFCRTINRLAVMMVFFALLIAHLSVILSFK
jgi:hypothetical protein